MKARHVCAVLGVAIAVGTVVFMRGLVEANDHQARAVAERLLKEVPVASDAKVAQFALDYRPNGRVMQGPPLVACLATVPSAECLVHSAIDANASAPSTKHQALGTKPGTCLVTKAMFAQRRLPVPPVGTELTLIGRKRTHKLEIAAVLDWDRPLRGYPNCFVSAETRAAIDEDWRDWEPKAAEELAPGFTSDAGRNFDRAKALLLWAAALTALCLLVNSLLLSIEARRKDLAILRMVGMTRSGVAGLVLGWSFVLTILGEFLGVLVAWGALYVYVALDPATFPSGLGPMKMRGLVFGAALLVALLAALIALRPAFKVKPLEAASDRTPRKRPLGMLIAFACGFGAFVAVEVWGASLMKAFVPSSEWPDAIVSILPGGVSSFDIAKLQGRIEGVKRIHELAPLQVNILPLEELKGFGGRGGPGGRRGKPYRNALLLGSDWLPDFKFVAGDRAEAEKAIRTGDNCIITEMMARARRLKTGDTLELDCGRGLRIPLKVVGIVDLNWHMVTSRGLVRGLNRMPVNTDGPVFVSFDTVEACDPRPAPMVKMTHLWLDYEPEFLSAHGVFEAGRRVEREIVKALGLLGTEVDVNAVRLHSRGEIADGTLAHGVEIVGSMARVPFIFLAVISLGFVAMLVASADGRRREFRVLRAVGATRVQLAAVLTREALKTALWGIGIGLPGGALAGWLFTYGTRAAMANWGIPPCFAMPIAPLAFGALGALVFALVVSVPAALAIVSPRRTASCHRRFSLFAVFVAGVFALGAQATGVGDVGSTRASGAATLGVLPLGTVRPDGWLRVQLEQQAAGLTGHAEELYDDIGRSDWLTGDTRGGEYAWERGPYYAKGLVSLAFALDDPALKAKAKRWVDALVASQRANGDFGPKDDNWWANMIALHFVRDWGEATGDRRVIPFLSRYFSYQLKRLPEHPLSADSRWAVARGGDNLEVVLWLRARTGDAALDRLADLLVRQTAHWSDFFINGGNGDWDHDGYRMHIVNFMQGLKFPALKWLVTGDVRERDAYAAAFAADGWAMRQHGRVDRMLNGTEPLSGREAGQGTELCAVAERILSTRDVIAATGRDEYADDLESVAYNSLPSHLGDDGRGMRYYSLLNQPSCCARMKLGFENNGEGGSFTPGPDSGFGCCRSNFHFAWPKFVQSMWMADGDGLRAVAYGPCTVSNEFCTVEERGDYPFGDRVSFKVLRSDGRCRTFRFRKPGWCAKMTVKLNGEAVADGTSIRRAWRAGDTVELEMPCDVTVERGNVCDSAALRRGALVYVLAPEAEVKALATPANRVGFPAREYSAKGRWNYALRLDADGRPVAADFMPPRDLSGNVFAHGRAVSALKVRASRTDYAGWGTYRPERHNNGRAIEPPPSPLGPSQHAVEEETLTLVPMGASQIRIALFPWYK